MLEEKEAEITEEESMDSFRERVKKSIDIVLWFCNDNYKLRDGSPMPFLGWFIAHTAFVNDVKLVEQMLASVYNAASLRFILDSLVDVGVLNPIPDEIVLFWDVSTTAKFDREYKVKLTELGYGK